MADSRVLDDVEELIIPAAIAIGGIYIVWWLGNWLNTVRDETLPELVGGLVDESRTLFDGSLVTEIARPLREGGLIDRWTLSPGEARRIGGRARRRLGGLLPW